MKILTKNNARRYCLRTQNRTEWYVYDLIHIPMVVSGLRNLNSYKQDKLPRWVLSWKNDANLRRAVELTFLFLEGWQAFRTPVPSERKIADLKRKLPTLLLRFQSRMKKAGIFCIADVNEREKLLVVRAMAEVVDAISKYKTEKNPMLASKILHFIFPEFFPVWDTYWIKNKCLSRLDRLGFYTLSLQLEEAVSDLNKAAQEYARHVELMLNNISRRYAAKAIRVTFLRQGESDETVVNWYYYNLTPTFFEMCLMGRFC